VLGEVTDSAWVADIENLLGNEGFGVRKSGHFIGNDEFLAGNSSFFWLKMVVF
jgi:hypothetical protein